MKIQIHRFPVSVIGAGKVATTLSVMLYRQGCPFNSIISRTKRSASALARKVHAPVASVSLSDIDKQTAVVMIATSDNALQSVVSELSKQSINPQFIFHVSGTETSDILQPLAQRGTKVFSLHPIQTFAQSLKLTQQIKLMKGVAYGFEGDSKALSFAKGLVKILDGRLLIIPKERKILYHCSCVVASNYTITLLSAVEKLWKSVTACNNFSALQPLIETSVTNALLHGPAKALTGPIIRDDVATVQKHIQQLSQNMPQFLEMYCCLGSFATTFALQNKKISKITANKLRLLFEHRKK